MHCPFGCICDNAARCFEFLGCCPTSDVVIRPSGAVLAGLIFLCSGWKIPIENGGINKLCLTDVRQEAVR